MKKIKNQKGITPLIILGAIMFLLLGVGGGYVVSKKITKQEQKQENKIVKEEKKEQKEEDKEEAGNKKDEIVDWKTYKNEEYGFEMKYLDDWKVDGSRSSENEIVFNIGIEESRESISFVDSSQALDDWKNKNKNNAEKISDMMIGGERAIRIDTTEFGRILIGLTHKNRLFVVTTGGRMIDNGMLSTLKFID